MRELSSALKIYIYIYFKLKLFFKRIVEPSSKVLASKEKATIIITYFIAKVALRITISAISLDNIQENAILAGSCSQHMPVIATQRGKTTAACRVQMVVDGAKILLVLPVKLVSAPLNEGFSVVVKPGEHRHRNFLSLRRKGHFIS